MTVKREASESHVRYRLIDTLRGISLLSMLMFHFCYDVFVICNGDASWARQPGVVAWERTICVSFILIAGISFHFSRRNVWRGLLLNACGLLITLVTAVAAPDQIVFFGILNGIGCSVLLTQAARPLLDKLNPFAGGVLALTLFALFYGLPERYLGCFGVRWITLPEWLYAFRPLAVIGLPDNAFFSSDYFPVVPWLFLYWCGFFAWRIVQRLHAGHFFLRGVPLLEKIGQVSLWVYMLHQPLLMGICYVFFMPR